MGGGSAGLASSAGAALVSAASADRIRLIMASSTRQPRRRNAKPAFDFIVVEKKRRKTGWECKKKTRMNQAGKVKGNRGGPATEKTLRGMTPFCRFLNLSKSQGQWRFWWCGTT